MGHINRWLFIISGFTQNAYTANGSERIWRFLRKRRNETTEVRLCEWSEDFKALTHCVVRLGNVHNPPHVCVFGYSWGGASAINFANHLSGAGIHVPSMVLCDPVHRHWHPLGLWRSLSPCIPLPIPGNVKRLWLLRQKEKWPYGHGVKPVDPNYTTIMDEKWVRSEHEWMDDSKEYLDFCERALVYWDADRTP